MAFSVQCHSYLKGKSLPHLLRPHPHFTIHTLTSCVETFVVGSLENYSVEVIKVLRFSFSRTCSSSDYNKPYTFRPFKEVSNDENLTYIITLNTRNMSLNVAEIICLEQSTKHYFAWLSPASFSERLYDWRTSENADLSRRMPIWAPFTGWPPKVRWERRYLPESRRSSC